MSDISHTSYVPIPTQGFTDDITVLRQAHMQTLENGIIKNDSELGGVVPVVNILNDMFEDEPDERIQFSISNAQVSNGVLAYSTSQKRASQFVFAPPQKYLKIVPGAVGASGATGIHGCIDGVWSQNVYGNIATTTIVDTSPYDLLCFQMITTSAASAVAYPSVYSQTLSRVREDCTEEVIQLDTSSYVESYGWSNRTLAAMENTVAIKSGVWVKAGDVVEYANPTYEIVLGVYDYAAKGVANTSTGWQSPNATKRQYVCPINGMLMVEHQGEGITAATCDATVRIYRSLHAKTQAYSMFPNVILQQNAAQHKLIDYGTLQKTQMAVYPSSGVNCMIKVRPGIVELSGTNRSNYTRRWRLYGNIFGGNGAQKAADVGYSGVFLKANHHYKICGKLLQGTTRNSDSTGPGWYLTGYKANTSTNVITTRYNVTDDFRSYDYAPTTDVEFCLWIITQSQAVFDDAVIAVWIEDVTDSLYADISSIAPQDGAKAHQEYTTGSLFMQGGILYKATAAIANGAAITPGTNCAQTQVASQLAALEARIAALESS